MCAVVALAVVMCVAGVLALRPWLAVSFLVCVLIQGGDQVRGEHLITLDVGHNTIGHQGAQLLAALIVVRTGVPARAQQQLALCMIMQNVLLRSVTSIA